MRRLRGTDAVAALIFANAPGQQAVPLVSAWDLNSFSWIQRGEDLDKLVEKSGSLSQQSKMFYKSARKVRRPPCTLTPAKCVLCKGS